MLEVALFLFAAIGIVNAWLSRQANEIQHRQVHETAHLATELRRLNSTLANLERRR